MRRDHAQSTVAVLEPEPWTVDDLLRSIVTCDETFLPPVPLPWLTRAARLPGAALQFALVAWLESRLQGSEVFHVRTRWREEFGISRRAESRALDALEAAGLIQVMRHRGRRARMRIRFPAHS